MSAELPKVETTPRCEGCPTATAQRLGELASHALQAQDWLFNNSDPDLNRFSPWAVQTAINFYTVSGNPNHPRYGQAKHAGDILIERNKGIGGINAKDGMVLAPEYVTAMEDRWARRQERQAAFDALPPEQKRRREAAAAPFLESKALTLLETDPELAKLQPLAEILEGREQDEVVSLARSIGDAFTGLRTIHDLDMGVPIAAARVLDMCPGPLAVKGMIRQHKVCPAVSPDSGRARRRFFEARYQNEQ